MKAELSAALAGMIPDSVLDVAVRLPKELLRNQAARVKGDKALIDEVVSSS